MKRHELTDEQWEHLSPLIRGRAARTGRPARDPRQMLNGIFWILGTGAGLAGAVRTLADRASVLLAVAAQRAVHGDPRGLAN